MSFFTYKIGIPNIVTMLVAMSIVALSVMLVENRNVYADNKELEAENKEIKRLSLIDYTSGFVIETNEILIIDRKTSEVKFVLTDTLAIQILTAKEYQLQVMEYERIISK